ncbi:MAG: PilW family protein [Stenotrophomonas sp.]
MSRFAYRAGRRHSGGFSLIELMIALVLGLLVLGAAFVVFQSNQNSYRANEGLNRIQESARVAFEVMSQDIRSAGGSACSTASVVETSGAQSSAFRDTPITGNATQLTVVSGEDAAYKVTASTATSVTLDSTQVSDATDKFKVGDWLLLCNARKSFVVQATSVSSSTLGFAALPGGYNPGNDRYAPPSSVVVGRLRSARWFVAANGRGGNSLYVSRFGGAAEEVTDGVQSIAFSYLQQGGTSYTATPADWSSVISVRADMVLKGRDVDGSALTRNSSNIFSLRSRTL